MHYEDAVDYMLQPSHTHYIKNHCCPTKIGFKNSTTLCHPWLQRKSPLIQNPGSTRCF
jgi:hypothetical protein